MAFNEIKYRARLVRDDDEVPKVLAGEGQMSQVFLNLLINAARAIDDGSAGDNEIRLRTWVEGGAACAEVRGTAKGIAPHHVDKIFEPFFTTKKVGSGSGLGLAISKNIVASCGGTTTARNEPDKGACFTVRIPLQTSGREPDEPSLPSRLPVIPGRILVVDDESAIRTGMIRMLAAHDVVEADGGAMAKRILEEDGGFDLVRCDTMMPEVSGLDLHEWLRERNPRLARQWVFITGGAFTPRTQNYLASVDNPSLEKPIDANRLRTIVAEFVRINEEGGQSIVRVERRKKA